jgi:RNA polymerase sigma-70 factor (ECF subfamily)
MKNKYLNIHQDLIDKCKRNNRNAQFQIYKLYFSALFNTCFRIVNDKEQAEDIMQEAFLSAFEKISSYQENVSFGAWLKRIVVNKSIDYVRKQKNEFETYDEEIYTIKDNEDFEITDFKKEELIKSLNNALLQLPYKYRIVFSLYYLEGYDHEEIAEINGITASTSRSQLTRAKQKIVTLLHYKT